MKVLLRKVECKKDALKLNFIPEKGVVENGFSGFISDGNKIKGGCAACAERFCFHYQPSELTAKKFSSFRKNPSLDVCPVDALSFNDGKATIDNKKCIKCGLCLHRCPYMAIQFDIEQKKCFVSEESPFCRSSEDERSREIDKLRTLPKQIGFKTITEGFSNYYTLKIGEKSKDFTEIGEIIVRNTLVNLGIPCNVRVHGNNHVRTEFFAELPNDKVLIGESNVRTEEDTLSVTRRIIDDYAVLVGRYGYRGTQIIPLAVLNGLPNKRVDLYEVIEDVKNVLKLKIYTVTYHILFLLNLFNVKLNEETIKEFYVSNKENGSLLIGIKKKIPGIDKIDRNVNGSNYQPVK